MIILDYPSSEHSFSAIYFKFQIKTAIAGFIVIKFGNVEKRL